MKKMKQKQKDEKVLMVGQQGHVVVGLVTEKTIKRLGEDY